MRLTASTDDETPSAMAVDPVLALLHAGQPIQAEHRARAALQVQPDHRRWRHVLALALAAQQRHAEARDELVRLRGQSPRDPDLLVNLGNACLSCGDAPAALEAFEAAAQCGATEVAYWLGHGAAAMACQRFDEACGLLQRAFQAEPDAADVRIAWAECLCELERLEEAGRCVAEVDPGMLSWPQRADLAWLLARCGHEARGDTLLAQCIDAMPDRVELRVRRALLLERLNRLGEAGAELARAGSEPQSPMHALARSRWLRRMGRNIEAQASLAPFLVAATDDAMSAQLHFEAARLHDAGGDADATMQALARAHAHARQALAVRHPRIVREDPLAWLDQRLDRHAPAAWHKPACDGQPQDPIFLVGFPRSGTTLMQQILAGHPALQVMEERPALEAAIGAFHAEAHAADLHAALDGLDPASVSGFRARYWHEVGRHLRPDGRRLLDKYPLTFTRAPYLARCFPGSRLLFMLRHPCDVVLSCHMQAFGLNGGVLAFDSLASTARAYARLMAWWEEQRRHVDLPVLQVRHEDLVDAPQESLHRVLDFLGLAQVDGLEHRHLQAPPAARIRTPSYAQVGQPLNRAGIGRWQRYRVHFPPETLDLLAPWVERYGYRIG